MNNYSIYQLVHQEAPLGSYSLAGWIKTHRASKNISFIEANDGTSSKGLQLVIEPALASYLDCKEALTTGASISFSGNLVESPAKGQSVEFQVTEIKLLGAADPEKFLLQKKNHSLEILRENLHLRPRSTTFSAIFRLRSKIAFAVHQFFQERGFYHIHTPIITTSDCEGAGEMFQVTNFDLNKPLEKLKTGEINYQKDFFKGPAFLTVSGQLEAEIFATAMSNVYTFGPTFRAENSNTTRHLSEFWMIEPEMSFCDLAGDMKVAGEFIVYLTEYGLNNCADELDFLHQAKWAPKDLRNNLELLVKTKPEVVEYTDAIKILQQATVQFEFPIKWGLDLQAEHEKYLAEVHFKSPVFVINWPDKIKPFYMRLNDDQKTVAAMDLLVPGVGEIIGGSQREDRYDLLKSRMENHNLDINNYDWYLQLREFGSVPHAGFGLGFERILMYLSGVKNIRDVSAIPRFPGHGGV